MVGGVVPPNAVLHGLQRLRLDQQGHPAGELPLDGPGGRGDPVRDVLPVQQVMEGKPLLVVGKEDVIADLFLSH